MKLKMIIKKHILFFAIAIFIVFVLGAYYIFFHDMPISRNTSSWGSFGAYFGGMVSFLSVILLCYTLYEQKKENHRNWFDAGFMRRLNSINAYVETNMSVICNYSSQILDDCRHSLYDDDCSQGCAEQELNNLYVNIPTNRKDIAETLYFQFKNTVEYIIKTNSDSYLKKAYLAEFSQSLRLESIVLIICVICEQDDASTISNLSKYDVLYHFQSGHPGFDNLKDALFIYNKEGKTKESNSQQYNE